MADKLLAVIPARGGSKRIPKKNILDFLGSPAISYSIDAAVKAGCFEEIMVSTDDKETASIARRSKASVPFFRSKRTSGDFATTAEVLEEVLREYSRLGREFSHVCCIYPTALFVTGEKIKKGYKLLTTAAADAVVSVVRSRYTVQRALAIKRGRLRMLWPENQNIRSQDLEPVYHDAGQFYWLEVKQFLKNRTIWGPNTLPLEVPSLEAQDINTAEDWRLAEAKFRLTRNI